MNRVTAEEIAHRIICDLRGRQTLGDVWDSIDEYTQYEIQREWADIAQECDA